jgi:1-aminocyclopropane-1-carboxylate deaminase
MAIDLQEQINIDPIDDELLRAKKVRLSILRLDQIHPLVSGNKWFKLKENIKEAVQNNCTTLLTFGGAYSNHLIATAAAAKASGLLSIGIVRGFHGKEHPTETLKQCEALGMQLHYVSREDYTQKKEAEFLSELQTFYSKAYIIPEGGDNTNGIIGAGEIASYIPSDTNLVVLTIGTGTTFAGIRNRLDSTINMLGLPVMKGGMYLKEEIEHKLNTNNNNWQLNAAYHFGGFAKYNQELLDFMNDFYAKHHIPLDLVYTAKMMYGVFDLLQKDYFPEGSNICCIHTGGLQGNNAVSQYLTYSCV